MIKGSKRVYSSTVKKWMGGTVGVLAIALLGFLAASGAITITDYTGDMECAGTPDDLCIAIINFTANTDIFVYPSDDWGLMTDKPIKNLKMYRSWGKSWREIDLNKSCTGTWCGGTGTYDAKYSYAFRKGRNYTIKYTAEKESPSDVIEWSFGYDTPLMPHTLEKDFVDPIWYGSGSDFTWITTPVYDNEDAVCNHNSTIPLENFSGVSYYNLNDNVLDHFGSNDGTVSGMTYSTTYPVFNVNGNGSTKSGSFDGVNDYVKVSNNIYSSPSEMTISAWFNRRSDSSDNVDCVVHHSTTTSIGTSDYWIGVGTDPEDYITGTIGANDAGQGWDSGETTIHADLDTWYNVVVTWDGSVVKTYVNGNLEVQYNLASFTGLTAPTRFGASSDGLDYRFNGLIDEVKFFNKSFNQTEVTNLYDSGIPNSTFVNYTWYKNDAYLFSGIDEDTLTSGNFSYGDNLTCEVLGINSTTVNVTNNIVPVIEEPVYSWDNATCDYNGTGNYTWYVNDEEVSVFTHNDWESNSSIVSGLTDVGELSSPTVFYNDEKWNLISGEQDGLFYGYQWSGSSWVSNSSIVSGLTDVGGDSSPDVFYDDGTWKLISGDYYGTFTGFQWSGSSWVSNSSIVSGLTDVGKSSSPTVFYNDEKWNLISGEDFGVFNGFQWSGSSWVSNYSIIIGLTYVGKSSSPTVFYNDEKWNLISGNYYGTFTGFQWSGSSWVSNSSIVSGLTDVGGDSSPDVFYDDGTWKLISGEFDGIFNGFQMPEFPTENLSYSYFDVGDNLTCEVNSINSSTINVSDRDWLNLGTHEEQGSIFWNYTNLSNKERVTIRVRASDGTNYSGWYDVN